ncbi:2' O-ribose methyltransferase [Marasmius tenuissimus]|uniref:rRNA methyltransferase 2, mitochondrial n=1 Tax=Marasmius tenuissimus TaxID=585030 RepID=A0ABR2ZRU4_9AGAR
MSFRPTLVALAQRKSSKNWLRRQHGDPFVKQRAEDKFNSRSAYKLIEISERNGRFLERDNVRLVIDLGAAPGGWSQIAARGASSSRLEEGMFGLRKPQPPSQLPPPQEDDAKEVYGKEKWKDKESKKGKGKGKGRETKAPRLSGPGKAYDPLNIDNLLAQDEHDPHPTDGPLVVAVDLLPIQHIPGVHSIVADFLHPRTEGLIHDVLKVNGFAHDKADVILSDIAPNMTGVPAHDNEAGLEVCRAVWQFARKYLSRDVHDSTGRGGVLLLKHFTHPDVEDFRKRNFDPHFRRVTCIKPESSRSESKEAYYLCQGFRGSADP